MNRFFSSVQIVLSLLLLLSSILLPAQPNARIEQQPTGASYERAAKFHQQGFYKEALELYKKSLDDPANNASGMSHIISRNIAQCEYGIKRRSEPEPVSVTKLSAEVNTPVVSNVNAFVSSKEQMLFLTSSRPGSGARGRDESGAPLDRVYVARRSSSNNTWTVNLVGKKDSKRYHEGVLGTSPDGKEIFIFRGSGNFFVLDIDFQVELDAADVGYSQLSKIYNVGGLKSDYHVSSMVINMERDIIYLCMNDYGENKGFGGYDIWKSAYDKSSKSWSKLVNLGPMINTEGDEVSISLLPDGKTLFFSSNGHPGVGKFDIYRSEYVDSIASWGKPVHLGHPINTPNDDIYYCPVPGKPKYAYYSSERPDASGLYDICMVTYYGKIVNEEEKKLLRQAYLKSIADAQRAIKPKEQLKPSEAKLLAKKGYDAFPMDSVAVGMKIYLNNIQFANAKATLLAKSYKHLEQLYRLLLYYPHISVEISGHTDNTGSKKINQRLSQERAESVVDYLIGRGIEEKRLKAKGYSDTQPIAPNKTDAGRALNRRVEFKIISIGED
jgi:outer membrane protein OmpA-like peptidoglycan-associated protein